jgi:hypothetical protein
MQRLNPIKSLKRAIAYDDEIALACYGIACIYSLREKKKLALQFLEKALQRGLNVSSLIERESDLKNIRNDLGWKKLKKRYS